MKTDFFVGLRYMTDETTDVPAKMGEMADALRKVFDDGPHADRLFSCKGETESIDIECEVAVEEDSIIAKCLVECVSTGGKVQLNKSVLSDLLAEHGMHPPEYKLEKRLVK